MFAFLTRATLRSIGRLLLAVMLFAQFALAAQACVGPRDMVQTLQSGTAPVAATETAPCPHHQGALDEAVAVSDETMPANLCVAHCTAGDQSSDTFQASIPPAPAIPVLSLILPPADAASPEARLADAPTPAVSPPIPILFGAFRS